MHRTSVPHAFDTHEVDQFFAILGLREDHDGANLRDRLRENRRREYRGIIVAVREVTLVERDVLDSNDAFVRFELRDAIDEEKRISVRQDAFDRGVVEGKGQVHGNHPV